jgi:hypothetical protein
MQLHEHQEYTVMTRTRGTIQATYHITYWHSTIHGTIKDVIAIEIDNMMYSPNECFPSRG